MLPVTRKLLAAPRWQDRLGVQVTVTRDESRAGVTESRSAKVMPRPCEVTQAAAGIMIAPTSTLSDGLRVSLVLPVRVPRSVTSLRVGLSLPPPPRGPGRQGL